MKKTGWKILLFLGLLLFLLPLGNAVYVAVTGFSGLAIMSPADYGLDAFFDFLILYSFVYWPTYLIGLVLIAVSVWHLLDSKK